MSIANLPKLLQPALKALEKDLLARAKTDRVEAGLIPLATMPLNAARASIGGLDLFLKARYEKARFERELAR